MVNDDLPGRIISGRVVIKPNVKEFSGSSAIFEDGTVVDEVRDYYFIPWGQLLFMSTKWLMYLETDIDIIPI